ncbi:MAG: O-antigen ligase family protein [Bacteroidota bacterium]|nr:O-antigen ligase family protein [Bacteroidota bacterium]
MAASLALGKFLIGASLFTLGFNWLFEGSRPDPIWVHYKGRWKDCTFKTFFRDLAEQNFKPKWRLFNARPAIGIVMAIVVLHFIGIAWSPDQHAAWNDLKIKLPLFIVPLIIGTTQPLSKKMFELLLLTFVLAVFVSTVSTMLIANGIIPPKKPITNLRDASVFVPLIRLSLMCALSVFFLGRWIVREKKIITKVVAALLIVWFLWFLQYMQSLTGLVILFLGGFILVVSMLFIYRRKMAAIALIAVFIVGVSTAGIFANHFYEKYFTMLPVDTANLNSPTKYGNPYAHDLNYPMIENGNQVMVYYCWPELDSAWSKRSEIPFTGKDINGDQLCFTALRYLSSTGSKKDADAIEKLSDDEIHAIEHGATNALDKERSPLERRAYQVCWELYHYYHGGSPSGNSVTMRMEFAQTALQTIRQHPWAGVGTGGQQKSYEAAYHSYGTKLEREYQWMHAHNQFLSIGVCLGIPALLYFIFSLWYAPRRMKRWRSYLYLAFFLVLCMSFFDDDTLETSQGVNFFAFFNALFLFAMPRESAIRTEEGGAMKNE